MVVLIISGASHLLKALDYEEAALSWALAAFLFTLRSHFHAESDRPSVWQGLRVLAGAFVFTLAYGVAGFYLLDRHFKVAFGFWDAVRQTLVMFTQFYDPGLEPITGFGRYFATSIYVVGAATFGYAILMLARPVLLRRSASAAEREHAHTIVEAHGRSSLARYTLFDDKSYYFSPGGSMVAYVAKGRAAVALGDPIGPTEDAARQSRGSESFALAMIGSPLFTRPSLTIWSITTQPGSKRCASAMRPSSPWINFRCKATRIKICAMPTTA